MTWTRVTATGSGTVRFRVSIEGAPYEPVSHSDMEVAMDGTTRGRYVGLNSDGWKFTEKTDPVRAHLEVSSLRINLADVAGKWTELFAKRPTKVSLLTANCDDDDTALTVSSTSGWNDGEVAYVDRETITVTPNTSTEFDSVERQLWDTLAAYHYTADGEQQRYPEITDWPVMWPGRRVRIFAYGPGDPPTGDGTQVWLGVMSRSPAYDGTSWSFSVDHVWSIMKASLGGDLADACPIRGIYYPSTAPLFVTLREHDGAGDGDSVAISVSFGMAGFWEDQASFCAELTVNIAAQMTLAGSFTQQVEAIPLGPTWGFAVTTTATPKWVDVFILSPLEAMQSRPYPSGTPDVEASSFVGDTSYIYASDDSTLGTVPRAAFGRYSLSAEPAFARAAAQQYGIDGATNPPHRIYLGGTAAVTSNTTAVNVDWTSSGLDGDNGYGPFTMPVYNTSASDRYIDVGWVGDPYTYYAAVRESPQIRQGRNYGSGTLLDFLTTLAGQTAEFVNTGAVPDIRIGDLDFATNEIDDAALAAGALGTHNWTAFGELTLEEVLEEHCKLIAIYPCTTSTGKITFKRIRLPAPAEVTSTTITAPRTDKQWLTYEPSAIGVFNTVLLRTGYDRLEDEHKGDTWKVRDVSAFGQCPQARVIEIAPKPIGRVTFADVVNLGRRMLGVFGGPYAYLGIEVPLTYFNVLLGDAVSITWSKVPNSDGGKGVEDKIGIVLGREVMIRQARIKLTILVTDQRIAGYVPETTITTIDSGADAGTGPFVVTVNAIDYFPGGVGANDLWLAGDLIRLLRYNSTTSTVVLGTITAATATTLTFTTDAAWTHSAGDWFVSSRVSTAIVADEQKRDMYIANADGTLDFSGDTGNPAFTLAP